MKKILILCGVIAVILIAGAAVYLSFFRTHASAGQQLPTYFSYTKDDLAPLAGLSSKQTIQIEDIYRSDKTAFDLVAQNTLRKDFTEESSKIYAYLAAAERDFAFLSYNTSGVFAGTINPFTKELFCTLKLHGCESLIVEGDSDAYSEALSKIVLAKVQARIAEDTAALAPYPILTGAHYWNGPQPSIGLTNGSSKGWFITKGDEFRAPPPPAIDSAEFKKQLQITEDALHNATPEQKHATVFWAGGPGTKTPPGQLLDLGDSYMKEKNVPLAKAIFVRSVVALAIADAVTAVFDSKYTYFIPRPFMMDSSIITIMPTPNHPSYPAGHSTLSTAATTVLAYYFPADTPLWKAKAEEAGMSRIWGGIHYVMDHNAGVVIGTKVGTAATQASPWKE